MATNNGIDWYRSGEVVATFPFTGSAEAAAERIRKVLAMIEPSIRPGSDVIQCHGEADFGPDLPLRLPACGYIAAEEVCTWTTRVKIDETPDKPLGTPGFLLGTYSTFRRMKFVGRCHDTNEDGGLIGWNEALNATATFYDCEFDAAEACDWSFYNWTGGLKSVTVVGGSGKFCRFGFALMDSGAGLGQSVSLQDFTANLAADGSKTYGESSNNNPDTGAVLSLVAIRGGKATLKNVNVEAAGLTAAYDKTGKYGCPRIAALVTDQYYSPGQACEVTLDGCTSRITKNNAVVAHDIDLRRSKLTVLRHEGSAADGSFSKWSK